MRARLSFVLPLALVPLLAAPTAPPQARTVAVLQYENNTPESKYDQLGRALSSMMITDLSVVDEIRLIERERVADLLREVDLGQSGYVDPETAATMGMMVGAEYVVAGAFLEVDPELRIDTRIIDVETHEVLKAAEVSGPTDGLLELQEELAAEFIDGLAIALTEEEEEELREQQAANGIRNVETALAFSEALCLFDYGAYMDALERMNEVRRMSPASAIVGFFLDKLEDRVAQEAKDAVKNEANRRIGGLLGRKPRPEAPEPEPRPMQCYPG